jgi:hypothetical protein
MITYIRHSLTGHSARTPLFHLYTICLQANIFTSRQGNGYQLTPLRSIALRLAVTAAKKRLICATPNAEVIAFKSHQHCFL